MMNTICKNRNRIGAFLLALIMTFGTVSGMLSGILPGLFTAEAATVTADNYYDELDTSKNGTAFRSALASLLKSTHKTYTSYSDLEWVFETADADPDRPGYIIWFYTGTSVKASGFGSGNGSTNREHVWPKNGGSAFPEKTGPGSDAHHLRPTEAQLNSTRGSLSFGEVSQTTGNIVKENGKTNYGSTPDELCYKSGSFFYPAKGYRGATARILMYMQVRWGDEYQLKFVTGAGSNKTIGDIETLMKWHLEEPPTEAEKRRNEAVFKVQGNRNPFIDHPEYASKIFCNDGQSYNSVLRQVVETYGDYDANGNQGGGSGTTPTVGSVVLSVASLSLGIGESRTVTAAFTPAGTTGELIWYSDNASIASVSSAGVITAHANGSVTITAALKSNPTIYDTVAVTVKSVTGITVSGTPNKTAYSAGAKFDPTGLTVKMTYTDGSSKTVANASCQWLDARTRTEALVIGTTQVICSYGGYEALVNGITVSAAAGGTVTIVPGSFTGSGQYAWVPWETGEISGYGYMYPGNKTEIQMNNSKPYYYLYNTTPLEGGIVTITIKDARDTGKQFEILTSATPYTNLANGAPSAGTSHGKKAVGTDGATWVLDTTDPYFAICYADTGAVYLASIEITYGKASSASCEHENCVGTVTAKPSFDAPGTLEKTCVLCGEAFSDTLPILNATDYETSENGTVYVITVDGTDYTFRPLRFYEASVFVSDTYRLTFHVPVSLFEGLNVTSYRVELSTASGLSGVYTNTNSGQKNGSYLFALAKLAPDRMVDTVTAVMTVTINGVGYSTSMTYSVADYCYDYLTIVSDAETRALLVDLLNYAAAAQQYTGHETGNLANAALSDTELAWGTQEPKDFQSIIDKNAAVVENAPVKWQSGGLILTDGLDLYFIFTASSVEGLTVDVTVDGVKRTVKTFTKKADGVYSFNLGGIGLTQFESTIMLTVCKNGTPVSNTLRYSAASYALGSYVYTQDPNLENLLYALMLLTSRTF